MIVLAKNPEKQSLHRRRKLTRIGVRTCRLVRHHWIGYSVGVISALFLTEWGLTFFLLSFWSFGASQPHSL